MLISALNAGYSLEHAFVEAGKECTALFGAQAYMSIELRLMCSRLNLNDSMDKVLMDFASRSDIEEIYDFCEVFNFAKRSGGDFIKILKNSADRIKESIEVMEEIKTVIAAKKLEQNIMNIIPFGILLYIDLASPEFLSALYGNLQGIVVMSICLILYVAAYFLSQKIVDIRI